MSVYSTLTNTSEDTGIISQRNILGPARYQYPVPPPQRPISVSSGTPTIEMDSPASSFSNDCLICGESIYKIKNTAVEYDCCKSTICLQCSLRWHRAENKANCPICRTVFDDRERGRIVTKILAINKGNTTRVDPTAVTFISPPLPTSLLPTSPLPTSPLPTSPFLHSDSDSEATLSPEAIALATGGNLDIIRSAALNQYAPPPDAEVSSIRRPARDRGVPRSDAIQAFDVEAQLPQLKRRRVGLGKKLTVLRKLANRHSYSKLHTMFGEIKQKYPRFGSKCTAYLKILKSI